MKAKEYSMQLIAADARLSRHGSLLQPLVAAHGPCALKPRWRMTPYVALAQAVISQQISGSAAIRIRDRLIGLFPDSDFPTPEQVLAAEEATLRSVGLSRQKISYLRDIALHAQTGVIPARRGTLTRLSDEEIVQRLLPIRGIGRWTVEMLLIFTLGRLDVLPVDDYGVRKGYSRLTGRQDLIAPRELRRIGESWAPYRSIAAWYLWRAAQA